MARFGWAGGLAGLAAWLLATVLFPSKEFYTKAIPGDKESIWIVRCPWSWVGNPGKIASRLKDRPRRRRSHSPSDRTPPFPR